MASAPGFDAVAGAVDDEDDDAEAADADFASFSGDLATGASLCASAGYLGQPAVLAAVGALRPK